MLAASFALISFGHLHHDARDGLLDLRVGRHVVARIAGLRPDMAVTALDTQRRVEGAHDRDDLRLRHVFRENLQVFHRRRRSAARALAAACRGLCRRERTAKTTIPRALTTDLQIMRVSCK